MRPLTLWISRKRSSVWMYIFISMFIVKPTIEVQSTIDITLKPSFLKSSLTLYKLKSPEYGTAFVLILGVMDTLDPSWRALHVMLLL